MQVGEHLKLGEADILLVYKRHQKKQDQQRHESPPQPVDQLYLPWANLDLLSAQTFFI
jgi:hypothetical protein